MAWIRTQVRLWPDDTVPIQAIRNEGSIGDVFRGTVPFFVTMLLMTVLLIHFQDLALWLPRKAFD